MTKYIELLREHENKKPKKKASEAKIKKTKKKHKKGASSEHNPYSEATSQNDETFNAIDELLEEEAGSTLITNEDLYVDDLLLADDDSSIATEEISPNTPENPPHPLTASMDTSKDDNIAAWLLKTNQIMSSIFEAVQKEEPMNTEVLNAHLQQLFKNITASKYTLDKLELEINRNLKSTFDVDHNHADLVQKSIMMMFYNIKVGLHLKLQYQELLPHTVAAMLHHMGMAMVPNSIRLKAGKLTKDEIQHIRQAPAKSIAYLESCHIDNDQVLLAISQATERYDGSGPQKLIGHEIAWTARLTGLLSMFQALIHFRAYHKRLLPRDAIRELVNHHKKAFDPVMLKALIESISLYPVGTFVQINTGEIGQVITVHNKFPLRPIIYINMDQYGNLITERKIDLKQQPNLMIQACMYEEALKELQEEKAH